MIVREFATCMAVDRRLLEGEGCRHSQPSVTAVSQGSGARHLTAYVEETLNATAGWLRVIGGFCMALAGSIVRNDRWRNVGTRTRLIGIVQCRLGASAGAIERLLHGPALRRILS